MQARRLRALAAAAIAIGLAVAPAGIPPLAEAARAAEDDCSTGWTDASEPATLAIYDTLTVGGRTVSVGTHPLLRDDRTYMTAWWQDGQWATQVGPALEGDAGLVAVGGSRLDRVWAVGFLDDGRARGIAAHWVSGRWVRHDPPRPASGGMVLSGVDVDPLGRVWAVGQSVTNGVVRTGLVMERRSGDWTRRAVPVLAGSGFTGVRALAPDDVWVIGSRLSGQGLRPIVAHWNGDRWGIEAITAAGPNALLSGIAGTSRDDLWAVGWSTSATGETRPLVLHRDATGWTVVEPPAFPGLFSVLADVSIDAEGRPWVVGGAYRDTVDLYVPVAARLDAAGWTVWPRPPGTGRYLDAVSGDPLTGGWMTGRSDNGGLRLRACEPVVKARAGGRLAGQGAVRPIHDLAGHESGPAPRRGLRTVPRLEAAVSPAGIKVRDAALSAGIDQETRTYGAAWADLDGDGRRDLFISGHAGPATLYLRKSGGFQRQASGVFRRIDRHDCDIARVDDDQYGDVICTGGADRGVGFKSNEIWIDPVLGVPDDQGAARGIADPIGRGRDIAVFDVEGDGDPDIVLGTAPMRWDSQPSPLRLMRNDGTGHFAWDPGSGIAAEKGAWCLVPADIDGDGDKDLLQCAVAGNVVPTARLVVLRNDRGRFRQVQEAWGVRSIGERDATVGNLGGDAHPDLVQLSTSRIRVSIWRDGRWVRSFERSIPAARAIAVGDVNGDRRDDIYLQLGSGLGNTPDVVLLNNGSGTGFTTLAVPSTRKGLAEDVIALDWNEDGLDDFLVLNGNKRPGPVQLITFDR
jgi:hypothetical protein